MSKKNCLCLYVEIVVPTTYELRACCFVRPWGIHSNSSYRIQRVSVHISFFPFYFLIFKKVFEAVVDKIIAGEAIGIFPEGGSHDRAELLPLKAGVTIMALGALQKDPGLDLKLVPVGLNYFHGHKWRSKVGYIDNLAS